MKSLVLACALVSLFTASCARVTVPRGTVTPQPSQCQPSDQDAFVYSPDRLEVLSPCLRVSGVVKNVITNPLDGDGVISLAPDPPFEQYLTAVNHQVLGGTLHVEVICYSLSLLTGQRARSSCRQNPDPLLGPLPAAGQHVWVEGRWVLDHSHGGWAELHPLYRWEPYP